MKPTLNLKCSGTCSYGIYLVHCLYEAYCQIKDACTVTFQGLFIDMTCLELNQPLIFSNGQFCHPAKLNAFSSSGLSFDICFFIYIRVSLIWIQYRLSARTIEILLLTQILYRSISEFICLFKISKSFYSIKVLCFFFKSLKSL